MEILHHVRAYQAITAEHLRIIDMIYKKGIFPPRESRAMNYAIHKVVKDYPEEFTCDCKASRVIAEAAEG